MLTLSVTSQPSVAFSPLTPTSCAGANLVLIANGVGGTAPYTATWVTAPAGNSYTVNYPAGVYTESVNITDANNCSAGASLAVNVIANPVVASNSVSLCQGAVATLSATGAATYTWLPSGFSGSSFTVSPPGTTQYTLSGTAVTGCTANAIVPAQVLPLAMLSFSTSTITCASLASATVSASGGTGPYSYTWMPGGQSNSVATGLIPNTYTLTVFDVGNGCTTSSISVFNSLVPLTGSLVNTPSLACNGASTGSAAVLNLSGGSGSQNYAWSNGVTTFTASSPGNLSAGQWSLSVTDALTACQVNSVFVITQAPAATLSIVASSPSLCAGTAVSFTANNAGGTPFAFGPAYTYTWSGGPVNSLYIATQTLTGIHIYTVNSSDANACVSSQTIAVNGVPNPTVTVSSVSICPLQTATLVASGASTYTWLPSLAIGASFTQALLSSTQYTVIGSALSCTAAATASISLKTLPQATLSSNAPLCNNQSLSLSALGGTAYVWSGPLGYGSSQQNPIINPVNPGQSGVYSLTLTGANSCTATAGVFVTVHATPTLSAIGSTLCSNQSVSLAAYSLPGATYAWLGPNGFSAATQVTVLAISAASLSGVYQVIATSAQGCSNTANANVTITAAPSVSITANNPLCVGSNLQLAGSGGVSYSWSGPGGFNATSQNPSILSVGLNHAGTYSLIATTGPCVLNALKTITVHPLPTPVANYNAPLCEGQPMQLQSTTATTYTWSGPQNFNNHNQNPVITTVSFSNAGAYSLSVTNANGCVAGTTLLVTVLQNPVAVVNSATVCAGGSATLTASGGLTYTWNGPNGFLATNPAVYFSQVLANQSGPYTVVVTGSNTCSSAAIAQLSVFNYAIPIPTIVATPSVCVNSNISLQASGGLSYAWAGPDGFVSTSNNISFVALHTGMTGTYTLSIVNSSYCVGSGTVFVKVFPLPNASLSSSKNNLCVPFCTEFKLTPAANSAPLQSYQYVVEGNFYSDQTLQYCIQRSGNNSAFVYFTDAQGCTNSSSLTITGYPKPKADFEFYPDKPLAGKDVVNFSNQSQGSGITNFMWVLSASDSVETEQTTFLFEDAGQYPVVLCVKNDWACADTIIKVVPVFEDFAMYIPNAFTPNNDGLNDVFKVISMGLKEFSIEIYNHWGTKVFATNDTQEGWNGEFNGTVAQLGVYNWRLTCVTTGGKRIDKTGYVLLEK